MLTVHRAERADTLADVLAQTLATPPPDPMRADVVAVPERGVERWLRQRLALRLGESAPGAGDGIAANIDFDSPNALLRQVVVALAEDPDAARNWYSDRLRWPVLQVIDEHLDAPELTVLHNHLTGPARAGRRLAAASTIARLLHGYGWQRPAMIADWARGSDTDGAGRALPDELVWQPWLWRLVREQVGQPHLAEILPELTERLRDDPGAVDLPARLALFGPTRISQALRAVLAALAEHRDVDLYLPHPSDALWRTVSGRTVAGPVPRTGDDRIRPGHPLLAALAGDVVELQQVLTPLIGRDRHHPSAESAPQTLLGALHAGLRADRPAPVPGVAGDDGTLAVHACHGPGRQVEVLRDRLLALMADDPTLEPRDVLIMCPDVNAYAPLIRGAFGQAGLTHPAYRLRVRLADRGLRETNGVLDVLAAVIGAAGGRLRSGELLDLLGAPAVRHRFGFTDDDLDTVAGWVTRAPIRWGMDATWRERFGLNGFPQATVATGLDRILLGVVADEDQNQWLETALPLAGVDSTDTDLAGRFAEFAERLAALLAELGREHTAAGWSSLLIETIDLLTDTPPEDQWQRGQAVGLITDALTGAGGDLPLVRSDIAELLDDLLAARPTRSNFCTGELTVATMTPMRSVPHRVIVLLGMDTGSFPRGGGRDGDDALVRTPLLGERDPGMEDRQVFLDAVNAATEHLLVFYSGADPVTGSQLPPAVVVSELVDAAAAVLGTPPGDRADPPFLHRHTLHAVDERNFRIDGGRRPASFDRSLLAGARTLARLQRSGPEAGAEPDLLAAARLPAPAGDPDVELDDLVAYLTAPAEAFVRQRLEVVLTEPDDDHPDQLDVGLDGLQRWEIGDRYLRALLDGLDEQAVQAAELRRGSLPPFALGAAEFTPIRAKAQAVALAAGQYRAGDAQPLDVRVELPDGRRLTGTVGEVFDGRLVTVTFSRLGPKHRLGAWIRLLAAAATAPGAVHEALAVGAARGRHPAAAVSRLGLPEDPAGLLAALVALRDAGLRRPLGLHLEAVEAAASAYRTGAAQRAMNSAGYAYRKAFADRYLGLVFAGDPSAVPDFGDLTKAMPGPAELGAAAARLPGAAEDPMFVRLAGLIFGDLLDQESPR
ncbi:exodeoxyribonuclease V subunit gamma [Gordonia sp. VNK21]|uniref:exodeoxyribonuclease V subunit gamma n=1 Tax=Gordonia sp. VNK21 TaxID=3382483 RepID=UPI0038D38FC0